eukprot:CAMPEP_0174264894 /NCGR_PEP_ID=MMETSP0439-20130205/24399_1 /TAXON_ID=0 /ORGANISM="Stereomyxa ramosa, Strain Chinc5" /LENGTH=263 /DNA_ID=CAMNT_0015351049 /DNA_START=475 /DNA_END=1266 /DNA_ORIENTATION=+
MEFHSIPTIIFVHGHGSSKETWLPAIAKLKDNYNIYSVDLRGHGQSPAGDFDLSTQQVVADLKEFVDNKKLGKFVMVGHSMGMRAVVPFAEKYPSQVSALVIEDMDAEPRTIPPHTKKELDKLRSFKNVHKDLESVKKELREFGFSQERIDTYLNYGRVYKLHDGSYYIGVNPYISYMSVIGLLANKDTYNALGKIKRDTPILLMLATSGSACSLEGLANMKLLLAKHSFQVTTIPYSHHSIHNTATDDFVANLHAFISKNVK